MFGRIQKITSGGPVDLLTTTTEPSSPTDGFVIPKLVSQAYDQLWMAVGFEGGQAPSIDIIPHHFVKDLPAAPDLRWVEGRKVTISRPATSTECELFLMPLPPIADRLFLQNTAVSDAVASHVAPDTTNIITSADATDLATGIVLANEAKADYNAHDLDAGPVWHFATGGSNQVTAADAATLEAELVTLCQDIQTQYNAHIADTSIHTPADTTNTLISVTITDTATCITFLNDLKAKYNAHRIFSAPTNAWAMLYVCEETQ
jgi:hypothetical protein